MASNFPIVSDHHKNSGKLRLLDKWVPHEKCKSQSIQRFVEYTMLNLLNLNDPFPGGIETCNEE